MNKIDMTRRKFLGRTGSLALTLPLAAVPASAAMTSTSTSTTSAAPARLPSRTLPVRQRGATVINAKDYGLPTDGISDCSAAINAAIAALPADGGTVIIPSYKAATPSQNPAYMIDTTANIEYGSTITHFGIQLRSNMLLQLASNVRLMAMPNNVSRAYILYANSVNDVEVAGGSLIGERYTHTYSGSGTDEWGMGMELLGVTGMTVRDICISNCNGDGICMGRSSATGVTVPTFDVVISNVICTGNRRQGMSITNASSIYVYDSEFSYTYGTAPQDGIDIEPDGTGTARDIFIDNCLFMGNAAAGVGMYAGTFGTGGAKIYNVNITNCVMCLNSSSGFYSSVSKNGITSGGTLYGNSIFKNAWIGIMLDNKTQNFTVGGSSDSDPLNNSFGDNKSGSLTYQTPNGRSQQGYSGVSTDIGLSTAAKDPANNNVINWNNFYSK